MPENRIDVIDLHKDLWKRIINYFNKELSTPFIYKTTRSQAYKDLFASIKDSGVPVFDIPVTHALLYFYPGEITDPYGRPAAINIFHGGILVPDERIKNDSENELSVGLTRENVRNFLRSSALIYSIALSSLEYHKSPEISNFLDGFDEIVSIILAKEILSTDVNEFSRILLRDKIISRNYLLADNGLQESLSDEDVEKFTKEINAFEKIKYYDPISEWHTCLETYSELLGATNFLTFFNSFYERFKSFPVIKRRNIDGKWEDVNPVL